MALAALAVTYAASAWAAPPPSAAWKDTTDGIHAFLTFDSKVDPALAAAYADKIDYVWGSTESKISWWRASKNPNVVLSKYIPFTRDPAPNSSIGKDEHLAWWQANHPELVLYTCDQKTPAWGLASGSDQLLEWSEAQRQVEAASGKVLQSHNESHAFRRYSPTPDAAAFGPPAGVACE